MRRRGFINLTDGAAAAWLLTPTSDSSLESFGVPPECFSEARPKTRYPSVSYSKFSTIAVRRKGDAIYCCADLQMTHALTLLNSSKQRPLCGSWNRNCDKRGVRYMLRILCLLIIGTNCASSGVWAQGSERAWGAIALNGPVSGADTGVAGEVGFWHDPAGCRQRRAR